MSRHLLFSILTVALAITPHSRRPQAADFAKSDHVILVISGPPAQSTPWGFSGKASMYRSTSTTSNGCLAFSEVSEATDVDCERRSAKKVNEPFDYTTGGQIPPGIYFVSYHRLDDDSKRHRLSLGDELNGVEISVRIGDHNIKRSGIQFHEAVNDLTTYKPSLSEGCIIFSSTNFEKLFQKSFLDQTHSPLHASVARLESARAYDGEGKVLAFVTDVTSDRSQERQLMLAKAVRAGAPDGLKPNSFQSTSRELKLLRDRWLTP
jgi:hypothetical protein